ncbi:MAG: hypothetical protein AAFQ94_27775 [Bacteroidota bacterium]
MSVEYYEIAYESTNLTPCFRTNFERIHSIDYSIILTTTNGRFELCWDDEFFQYGIGINNHSKTSFSNSQCWNVSTEDIWAELLGCQITSIKIDWDKVTTQYNDGTKEQKTYPQSIRVSFSNHRRIFISAAGFLNEDDTKVMGMMDNLIVSDDEVIARKVRMIV